MSRAENAAKVAALRAEGLTQVEVAKHLGLSRSYVGALDSDPQGVRDRIRRDGYRGVCEDCGARTDGSEGPGKAPRWCAHCAPRHHHLIWTPEVILDAIRRWAERHGQPPTADQWRKTQTDEDGYRYPATSSVYDSQNRCVNPPFEEWADAIEAAGFPRPTKGHKYKKGQPMTPTAYKSTRTYVVFAHRNGGDQDILEIVGTAEATSTQEACEQSATGEGRYSAVPLSSLQTYNLRPRMVAERAKVDASPAGE